MKIYIILLLVVLSIGTTTLKAQWINGQNAGFVIGQPDFTSNQGATTQN